MTYRLLSVAETELAETTLWYEEQSKGLGRSFLDEFEAVMLRISKFPEAWKRVGSRHRRCLFRRFPFAVLYAHSENEIIVSGVIDLRKDPAITAQRTTEL
ncbi:hypothetical protein N9023_05020 [Opitutaceae bacterium]|nr:hypothetical protein [Opitutaceae bacterium]MDB4474348.1 hypothetical protein [Opitutaceae bacterium]